MPEPLQPPSAPWEPADASVRQRIVTTLDRPLVVEAGAGTGKTTLLVERLRHASACGAVEMPGVVAISFTEKAAAELRLRLRQSLERAAGAAAGTARERLRRALQELHRAQISTIHAYASALLHERPAEAHVEPQFRVLDELEALQLQRAFWRAWVDSELDDEHGAGLLRAALEAGVRLAPDLHDLVRALYENRDLEEVVRVPAEPRDVIARMHGLRRAALACWRHAQESCREPSDRGYVHLEGVVRHLQALDDLAPAAWPMVFLQGLKFDATSGRREAWAPGAAEASKDMRRALQAELQALQVDLDGAVLRRALLWSRRFLAAYEAEKRRLGVVDFQDLLLCARDMLRNNLTVRRDLGRRVHMLCVDEFQDTDPLQAEIVLYLAEAEQGATRWQDVRAGAKLFLVGDPKQSIYRFRRADLDVYARCRDIVLRSGGEVFDIVQNFRSRPAILNWTNGVFAALFGAGADSPQQPRHVPLVPLPLGGDCPAVWVLRPPPGAAVPESADAWRRQEARAVVSCLQRALHEEWPVRDGESTRPLQLGDVALLFGRTSGIEHYEDALRAAGLPFRQEGGKLFFQRQEVRDVLHALAAIDDPRDELALVAALRSPLFGASDEDLWRHRSGCGGFDYLAAATGSPLEPALHTLAALHAERHGRGVGGITQQLLVRTSARAVYGAQPQGERAVANFEMLLRRARAFEAQRPASLREFVLALRDLDEEAPRLAEWSPEEEGGEQVRLLTVHMAKGLEFPMVILANLAARGNPQHDTVVYDRAEDHAEVRLHASDIGRRLEAPGYLELARRERERERAEEHRLLYVAATRARDYLVVGTFQARRAEGLLQSLQRVPGALGDEPLGELPRAAAAGPRTPSGAAWCVWPVDVPPRRLPVRQRRHDDVGALREASRRWRAAHERIVAAGTAAPEDVDPDAWWEMGQDAAARCERLVHRTLAELPLEASADRVEAWTRDVAGRHGLEDAVDDALPLVCAALASPLWTRARAAPRSWRGVRLRQTRRGRGYGAVLDLVIEEAAGAVLVDCTTARAAASATALVCRAHLLAQAGRNVVEAGTLFLREGAYEQLADLSRSLEALERAGGQ